jgi:hypothetical protein
VDVVYITVPIVIYARFSARLWFIGPELIAYVLMVDVGAVIENGNDDRPDHLAISPRERACDIINPPEVTGAIRAIVGGRVVD